MTHTTHGLGAQLRLRQAALAETVVHRQFAARPDLAARYGPEGRARCLEDANYHLAYLADAMDVAEPALFTNYVAWASVMLGKRSIPVDDLTRYLELTRTVVRDSLEGDAGALAVEYLDAGLARLASVSADLPSCLAPDGPYADLARAYLASLLKGERHLSSRMILEAVASGATVKAIYLHVFQPVQHEVGRLWQVNEISVAQEHYCTAATQLVMSQLYPQMFASDKTGGTLVAACVAGDLHEIGLRMVTDFFEMEGWNTFYLGSNMPTDAIVDTVVLRRAHVLGISATMASHLRAVSDLIDQVRARPECRDVKILVGGYPFLVSPHLWQTMGADGGATNAQEAIILADRWIAHESH